MNNSRAVDVVDPIRDPRWTQLSSQTGGLFHSAPWMQAVANAYGFHMQAALVSEAGETTAGLPFSILDDCVGTRIVSLPFTDTVDPLGSAQGVGQIVEYLQSLQLPLQLRLLDSEVSGLPVAKRARWHRLNMTDPDALWRNMTPAMRRGVRKAQREGVVIQPLDGRLAIEEFLNLHAAIRKRKYHLLAQPARFFESIRDQFLPLGNWLPLGAYHQSRLIAVTVYLRWGQTLYYKFNASAVDALPLRPNNLLVWEGAKMAYRLGCTTLDLGPSDDHQPGLIRFKADTGAAESELQFRRWTPEAWSDPRGDEQRRLLGQLTALLVDPSVPDDVSIRGGALLYRYFA